MLDKLSEPNREQISVYLNGLWDFMLREISASRSVPVDSLRAFADSGRAFGEAETFVRASPCRYLSLSPRCGGSHRTASRCRSLMISLW